MTPEQKKMLELVYDLNISLIYSGAVDHLKAEHYRVLFESVLTRHQIYDEWLQFLVDKNS